jgi:hypothetical protein
LIIQVNHGKGGNARRREGTEGAERGLDAETRGRGDRNAENIKDLSVLLLRVFLRVFASRCFGGTVSRIGYGLGFGKLAGGGVATSSG